MFFYEDKMHVFNVKNIHKFTVFIMILRVFFFSSTSNFLLPLDKLEMGIAIVQTFTKLTLTVSRYIVYSPNDAISL